MENSILKGTKLALGYDEDHVVFDDEILMHINTALSTLTQLGVGPDAGFTVQDDTATWADFYGDDDRYNGCRTYTYLKVRQLFDPPQTSYLVAAMQTQLDELTFRIGIVRETSVVQDSGDGTYVLSDMDISVDEETGVWTASYEGDAP